MMKLTLGSIVCFDDGNQRMQVGTLIKFNQKTVTVRTDDGRRRWKVWSPILSTVFEEAAGTTLVFEIQKK